MLYLRNKFARVLMSRPIGMLIDRPKRLRGVFDDWLIVTVGDIVTSFTMSELRAPDIAIIDGKTQRNKPVTTPQGVFDVVIDVINKPSTLNPDAIKAIERAFGYASNKLRVLIRVKGEEDLLAIPAILKAPDRTIVMYGLPSGAIVVIPSHIEYKLTTLKLLVLLQPM